MDDLLDYEEQSVHLPIRESIVELVDGVQWLDQVKEKEKKEFEKQLLASLSNSSTSSRQERCLLCTLPMGTCEHTINWYHRQQEKKYVEATLGESDLDREISDAVGILSEVGADVFEGGQMPADDVVLEHMAWLPLEEKELDKIGDKSLKLSSPNDRVWHSSVLLDGFIVVFGGLRIQSPHSNTFTRSQPLPLHALDDHTHLEYLNDIKAYDIKRQVWETLKITLHEHIQRPQMPCPRYGHGAAALDGTKFVIFGGRSEGGKVCADTWVFDLRHCNWTYIDVQETSSAFPAGRFFTACCADHSTSHLQPYSDLNDTSNPLHHHHVSHYDQRYRQQNLSQNTVYLFGGTNGTENFGDLWLFYLEYEDPAADELLEEEELREEEELMASLLVSKAEKEERGNVFPDDHLQVGESSAEQSNRAFNDLLDLDLADEASRGSQQRQGKPTANVSVRSGSQFRSATQRRYAGRWERGVAAGLPPCPRYGHSLQLLRRPAPPGSTGNGGGWQYRSQEGSFATASSSQSNLHQGVVPPDKAEEECFILVLGGCHVSPASEGSVGASSDGNVADTMHLVALAQDLQRCYAAENASAVLSTTHLQQLLEEYEKLYHHASEPRKMKHGINYYDMHASDDNNANHNQSGLPLVAFLRQASGVSHLLHLREKETRKAEQALVDAYKLRKAMQALTLRSDRNHTARHTATHLDIHWLRIPTPASTSALRNAGDNQFSVQLVPQSSSHAHRHIHGYGLPSLSSVLQWEVSDRGRELGLCGGPLKYRPSARMHFGCAVVGSQQQYLIVLGGIQPTSLAHVPPAAPHPPATTSTAAATVKSLVTSSGSNKANSSNNKGTHRTSSKDRSDDGTDQEAHIHVLDLRTMAWKGAKAVNSEAYFAQSLACAYAEVIRAQAHLQHVQDQAVTLLGISRHRADHKMEQIDEVRLARRFVQVCRWRYETLQTQVQQDHHPDQLPDDAPSQGPLAVVSETVDGSDDDDNGEEFDADGADDADPRGAQQMSRSTVRSLLLPPKHKRRSSNNVTSSQRNILTGSTGKDKDVHQTVSRFRELDQRTRRFVFRGLIEGHAAFSLVALGQRLICIGGNVFEASTFSTSANTQGGGAQGGAQGGVRGGGIVTPGSGSGQRPGHTACCKVLSMEAEAMKLHRWQINYHAALDQDRREAEEHLRMHQLVSLHALRAAREHEARVRDRETRAMQYEDYRSRLPPLFQPPSVNYAARRRTFDHLHTHRTDSNSNNRMNNSLKANNASGSTKNTAPIASQLPGGSQEVQVAPGPAQVPRASAHSIWIAWDDLLEVAKTVLRRHRYQQTHLPTLSNPNPFQLQQQIQLQLQATAPSSSSYATSTYAQKQQLAYMDLRTATALVQRAKDQEQLCMQQKAQEQELRDQTADSQTVHSNKSSSSSLVTYLLYGQIGFEMLQPGDVVDVLPKDTRIPRISRMSDYFSSRQDAAQHRLPSAGVQVHEEEDEEAMYPESDLWFDDVTRRHRGVLQRPSPLSYVPGYYTVKYDDKTLETKVSRHRIRRVYETSNANNSHRSDTNTHLHLHTQSRDPTEEPTLRDATFHQLFASSNGEDAVNGPLSIDVTFDSSPHPHPHPVAPGDSSATVTADGHGVGPAVHSWARLPSVQPGAPLWTLLYAGDATSYDLTSLVPRHVLDSEPHLQISVMLALQVQGIDAPLDQERSQLSRPVLLRTVSLEQQAKMQLRLQQSIAFPQDSLQPYYMQTHPAGQDTTIGTSSSDMNTGSAAGGSGLSSHGMSRTKKQVISAVIQSHHMRAPSTTASSSSSFLTTNDTKKKRKLTVEDVVDEVVREEEHEEAGVDVVEARQINIERRDVYCWAEGQGEHYA